MTNKAFQAQGLVHPSLPSLLTGWDKKLNLERLTVRLGLTVLHLSNRPQVSVGYLTIKPVAR